MGLTNYNLRYHNCQGVFQFNLEDVISLDYGRKKNDLGVAVVVLNGANYDIDDFDRDGILEIYRQVDGVSTLVGDTCWFLRKYELAIDSDCNTEITLTFYDTIHLLTRRVIAWSGVLTSNYPSQIRERLDDTLWWIAYFNFGPGTAEPNYIAPGADPAIPANFYGPGIPAGNFIGPPTEPAIASWQFKEYGTVEADLVNRQFNIGLVNIPPNQSTITTDTHNFEQITLLQAMQDVANSSQQQGESLWFDILYTPSTTTTQAQFNFKTWVGIRGSDRTTGTNRIIIGPEYGTLTDSKVVKDWENEKTLVYIGGQGENELRSFAAVSNNPQPTCPFYPIEAAISENSGDSTVQIHNAPELEAAGRAFLYENRAIETLTGTILSNDLIQFFSDIDYGDIVIAQFRDFQVFKEIDEYNVTADNSGEEISVPLTV